MSDISDDTSGRASGDEELLRLREMFAQSPSFSALLHGPEYRFVLTNPAYQQLVGHRAVIGLTVREAFPEVESQGFLALLDEVFSTGKPFIGRDVEIVLRPPHGGAVETHVSGFRLSAHQRCIGQCDVDLRRGLGRDRETRNGGALFGLRKPAFAN